MVPAGPTLYVGGQNGMDNTGALLDGLEAQTEQAIRNVLAVLVEAGTGPDHVAKPTIYLAAGVDPRVSRRRNPFGMGRSPHRRYCPCCPTSTTGRSRRDRGSSCAP